ncbi:hypothetical protein ARTHRO9AX_10047 [Arthrobacter sp. 9AX]|uniref:hypothetical protein n=1 Tax=Arthrobacter sp. 9AX TaxID=2653131 RepID=UPI0012F00139|nr:hypothetical protein [Arthrobacter sp. 9AX]VXA94663.1 hypothetical protein ARTHRO9AX_10047 [Arthrobacter sp. 9AX]
MPAGLADRTDVDDDHLGVLAAVVPQAVVDVEPGGPRGDGEVALGARVRLRAAKSAGKREATYFLTAETG